MSTLLSPDGAIANPWQRSPDAATDHEANRLVPADRWQGAPQGLLLAMDDEPESRHCAAPLIAVDFSAFNDGRGLSLAVLLRRRLGFTGELRASGAVHPDLLHYMIRCGFDTFELPDDYDVMTAMRVLRPHKAYYQGSVVSLDPVYRRLDRSA